MIFKDKLKIYIEMRNYFDEILFGVKNEMKELYDIEFISADENNIFLKITEINNIMNSLSVPAKLLSNDKHESISSVRHQIELIQIKRGQAHNKAMDRAAMKE